MKVIERREPVFKWPREFVCEHCKSQLEVDAHDVVFAGPREDDGRGWFRCPVCLRLNYLTSRQTTEAGEWLRIQRGHAQWS